MPVLSLTANTHPWEHTRVQKRGCAGTLSHAEAHMTLHTNTHNRMHMLRHTSLCSCDCTGVTSAHTYMYIQTQHLQPARTWLLSAPHTQPAPHRDHQHPRRAHEQPRVQPPQAATGVSRAPACTHTTHTLSTSPHVRCSLFCSLEQEDSGLPAGPRSQTCGRDRHTPHPTKEPLCTPSPSAPHTLRQTEHQGVSHWS